MPAHADPIDAADVLHADVPLDYAGRRLDQVLALLFPAHSRAQLQQWLRAGLVTVAGAPATRASDKVKGGEAVCLHVPAAPPAAWAAEEIALEVVYEDEHLLVIDKPAGLVVHPGAGNPAGTLLNALLHRAPELGALPRAGIVHRLDKDTSGLLVVARTELARRDLIEQLQAHTLAREYQCVVNGVMIAGGTVDAAIGRHRHERTRMAVDERGKPAVSHYRVAEKFRAHCLLNVRLESGRTHQIRVHMAHLQYPLVGDPVYGGRMRLPKDASAELVAMLRGFKRQALHAQGLGLEHPATGKSLHWTRPPPADFAALVASLRADAHAHG